MSSILKALQKLEQERPKKAYPRIWVRNENSARDLRKWLVGLAAGLLLAGGGVAGYHTFGLRAGDKGTDSPSPRSETRGPVTHPSNAAKHVPPVIKQATGDAQSIESAQPPAAMRAKTPVATARGGRAAPGREAMVGQVITSAPKTASPAADEGPEQSTRITAKAAATGMQPQTAPNTSLRPSSQSPMVNPTGSLTDRSPSTGKRSDAAQETATLPADVLKNASLKIQAISWSETPRNRIAVVNSEIVREGESIDGYHIKQINPDDMILSKGGLDWMLKFEHQ